MQYNASKLNILEYAAMQLYFTDRFTINATISLLVFKLTSFNFTFEKKLSNFI